MAVEPHCFSLTRLCGHSRQQRAPTRVHRQLVEPEGEEAQQQEFPGMEVLTSVFVLYPMSSDARDIG